MSLNFAKASHKLLRSKYLLPVSEEFGREKRIEDGYVLFENNTIKEVGPFSEEIGKRICSEFKDDIEIIGSYNNVEIPCHNAILLPSFIKGHGHDHESPIIGVAKDVPLTTWLDEAVNIFTGFLNENVEELTDLFGMSPYLLTYVKAKLDDLSFGITSSMTHHCNFNKYHVGELVEANAIAGTSNIIAVGAQDRNYDDRILDIPSSIAIDRLNEYEEKYGDVEHVDIIPGPDQFFSNGPELLKVLKEWSRERGKLFHIHSSEEPNTTKWFVGEYGMTPIEYASSIGVLDEKTVVAHQVNNTPHDLQLLKETKTSVIHNPLANTILGSGMPEILKMIDLGIPVAIATDGSGSADNQNIINAARVASQYQKARHQSAHVLPAQQCLEMITIEPAKILGLNKGSLEPGKDADMILVDLDAMCLTPTLIDNVVENLIWAASGNEISHVISNGRLLIEDYEFVDLNVQNIKKQVRTLAGLFYDYKKTAKGITGTGVHQ